MTQEIPQTPPPPDPELSEWIDSLDEVLARSGPERAASILEALDIDAQKKGVVLPHHRNTPYLNTLPLSQQPPYPGDREMERRIKSLIRWNAMAMVVHANKAETGIGGHISTYASAATLYEVGFNHFFRGRESGDGGDFVFFQGHAAPGIYARAFLEGRISEAQLLAFRHELSGGLASYPHPYLMPDFWQFSTVSMGLGPLQAIYQARFNRYLEDRGLKPHTGKVWAFLGDGETDEPESLGAITLASREKLDNLVFVINCNLQRLDGPVRGNGQIIQELEAAFRGAGWNVIKVIWGGDWDPLFARDTDGALARMLGETVDGQFQKFSTEDGATIRRKYFGRDPRLLQIVAPLSDDQLRKLRRGGHDPEKVYAAYRAAVDHTGSPTVILAKTIKGYGLGESGEGKNITHQQKKLNEDELREFRSRFGIPLDDEQAARMVFFRPPADSPEIRYLTERRRALGGFLPARSVDFCTLNPVADATLFDEFAAGTPEREVSTTMVFVRILSKLLRDASLGRHIVPIVPDEARTFGMEALFRQCGIYSHPGQLYEPVDSSNLIYYKEVRDGQILEEGITEAGSMASFIAAGTAYANHGVSMVPFFVFYSMFGFQRVGDLIWAAADMCARGFLIGATSGRTTLAGEGLQHQDGHSHVLASTLPSLMAYDPAFAFEIAAIVREGIDRMFRRQDNVFYYITVGNENYSMPPMPEGVSAGDVVRGLYRFRPAPGGDGAAQAHLFGSGAIMNQVLAAQELLAGRFGVRADVWSVTSYKELRRDALETERWNLLHPGQPPRASHLEQTLGKETGVFVAATDYMRLVPDMIARWMPGPFLPLGTDGYGRSEGRRQLREFFEVDSRFIAVAALSLLAKQGGVQAGEVARAIRDLGIDPEKINPLTA